MQVRILSNPRISKRAVMHWLDVPGTVNLREQMFEERSLDVADWLDEHHPTPVSTRRRTEDTDDSMSEGHDTIN